MMSALGWIFLVGVFAVFLATALAVLVGPVPPRLLKTFRIALISFWIVSALVLAARFIWGLGPISHMTDRFPWGVWIGLLQSGVALAAGGYVIAATVHIFHVKRFEPILRPMVLTAFLGYTFVALTLFIEVGRPYRLWHPLVMWQHNSIMFEVAWCVTIYMTVLMVEFSPVVFERFGMHRAVHALHVAAIPIVIAGVILSTLHQSSMGSMFLILPQKIHPLWHSPLLPVFFLVSSVAVGLCMTVVESVLSYRIFGRSFDRGLLQDLGQAAAVVLILYTFLKVVDIVMRGAWSGISGHPWLALSFFAEVVGGALAPALILLYRGWRKPVRWTFVAAVMAGAGVMLNRLNVSWFSMTAYAGTDYFPTWMELTISLFLVTATAAAFGLAVRYLPVFPLRRPAGAPTVN